MVFNPLQQIGNSLRTQVNGVFNDFRDQAQASVQNLVGSALNVNTGVRFIDNTVNNFVGDTIGDFFNSTGFNSASRSRNLPNASTGRISTRTTAQWSASGPDSDWRVRLSVPSQFGNSRLLSPLSRTGGLVFPYTPSIIIGHSASYNQLHPVHTNYPFQVYENSRTDDIVITGDFTVENAEEGRYWVAAVHYLRSVTKMFYGDGENSGAPPPLVKLNGYGDYVFNNVPCVVTNFTVDLPSDVDYISCVIESESSGMSWAPTQSIISVTLQPTYSRSRVSEFNLNDFVNGKYVTNGTGFI